MEALLSFTAPPDKPVSSKVVKSEDGYEEAHPPRGRGGGRGRSDRRAVKAQEHGRGAWASQGEGEGVRNGIATPKAVKAATSSASAGPSLSLPGLQAGPGPHINLGMGLGAFAGTFPNGLNGAYYPGGAAAAAQAAAAQAQGALWPPSFPGTLACALNCTPRMAPVTPQLPQPIAPARCRLAPAPEQRVKAARLGDDPRCSTGSDTSPKKRFLIIRCGAASPCARSSRHLPWLLQLPWAAPRRATRAARGPAAAGRRC